MNFKYISLGSEIGPGTLLKADHFHCTVSLVIALEIENRGFVNLEYLADQDV